VINCTFSNNNSAAGTGGAIYNPNANEETGVAASTLTVINSTFSGNVASTSNGLGGAIYSAGTLRRAKGLSNISLHLCKTSHVTFITCEPIIL